MQHLKRKCIVSRQFSSWTRKWTYVLYVGSVEAGSLCYTCLVSGRWQVCRVGRLVAAGAAPCGGTGRWGWRGARGSLGLIDLGASASTTAPASRKKAPNPNFGSCLARMHDLSRHRPSRRVAGAAIWLYVISTRARRCSGFNRAVSHARVTLFFIDNRSATIEEQTGCLTKN